MTTEPSTSDDASLVQLLASEMREDAFRAIFEKLHEQVFALCRNLTGSRAEAEDAVQEAFLAVHRGLDGFRGEARLSTWVYRIAIHAALGVTARRKGRRETALDDAVGVGELADRSPLPDALAASRQNARRLERALAQLGPEHRTVLALFAVEGLGHEQIAHVLGIPTGTVWSRLHVARKRIAAALADR
jgi:RNA polymerase sigma-70 factor (ECF subfamily)